MELVLGSAISVWGWLLEHLLCISLLFSIVIIFFQRRGLKVVWIWFLALNFLPVFGIVFYLLFGQDLEKSRMFRVKEINDRLNPPIKSQEEISLADNTSEELMGLVSGDCKSLILYNLEASGSVLTVNNKVKVHMDEQEKFEALRNELRQARRFIHIRYYIIKSDELSDSIVPILLEEVKEDVEVRILRDRMGGKFMPEKRWEQMKEAGTKIGVPSPPFLGWPNLHVSYHNHRKIVVTDGCTGFVGGFNMGREYISKNPKFGYWRDTYLKIMGEVAISLQIRFALDWSYATGKNLFKEVRYLGDDPQYVTRCLDGRMSPIWPNLERVNELVTIQIIINGSDTRKPHIRNSYLELFHKVEHNICIQTPYFIPDDVIFSALRVTALSGANVRLMIPCKPDHPFVYWITRSYAGELLDCGARVYVYKNGLLHSKGITIDERVSCYGTANMDIRSFELNFGVNATIYDEEVTGELEEAFVNDPPRCCEITEKDYMDKSLWICVEGQCSRLLSPLL